MSILIKGMDMPKGCDETCLLYLVGQCCEGCDCPLIEIPTPHGRLIDGDEFTDVCEILADKGGDIRIWEQAEWIAKDMPTILEAEE